MDLALANRRALVVGGSGLLGRAIADRLVEERCTVVLAGRTLDRLRVAADDLVARHAGARVDVAEVDTTDHDGLAEAVARVAGMVGGIEILVNSGAPAAAAVIAENSPAVELSTTRSAFETKALGYLAAARAVIPHMTAQGVGAIVNICGQQTHFTGAIPATVRNAAVTAISKSLADELAGSSITVNAIHPGYVADVAPTEPAQPGRPGTTTPAAVAALTAFLASPLAATISGTAIDLGHSTMGFTNL